MKQNKIKQEAKLVTKWNKHRLNKLYRHAKDTEQQPKGCRYKRAPGFDPRMHTMT